MARTNDASIPGIEADVTGGGTPAPADARGNTITSTGGALAGFGAALQDSAQLSNQVDVQRAQAQQDAWLAQAKSGSELQAQQISDQMQRSAQPGQPIFNDVQNAWQQHVDQQLDGVDNPILKAKYSAALSGIGGTLAKTTQAFDYQQQDDYATRNIQQAVNNKTAMYQQMDDPEAITTKTLSDVGEATNLINNLQMAPDKKAALLDSTRKQLVVSAMQAKTAADPSQVLNENAPARSPAAVANDPNAPASATNNNFANLEGDLGFQGQTGTDDKGFAVFDTPQNGLRAATKNILAQQDLHGLNTVSDIISKLSPPNENDTQGYIDNVSKAVGVDPDEAIDLHDPATLAKFTQAVIKQEGNGASSVSNKNVMYAVQQALDPENDTPDPGMTRPDGGVRTGDPLFALLKPDEQQQVINHAEAVYRQQQFFSRQNDAQGTALFNTFSQSLATGVPIDDDQMSDLHDIVNQSTNQKFIARANKLFVQNAAVREFQPMAPVDIQNTIAALEPTIQSGKASPADVERYNIGLKMINTIQEKVKTDPLSVYAKGTGQPIPAIDPGDPDTFADRSTYAEGVQNLYGSQYKAFTPAETSQYKNSFDAMPPVQQRTFLANMAQGFGSHTADAARQIFGTDSPEIAYAATMLADPNKSPAQQTTAMQIVNGSQLIKNSKDNPISTEAVDKAAAQAGYADAMTPQAYRDMLGAAKSVYAARYGASYGAQQQDLTQLLSDVAGGEKANVNGTSVIAPSGVAAGTFQKFAENLTPDQVTTAMQKAQAALTNDSDAPAPKMPMNTEGFFNPNEDKLRLKSVGNNTYVMLDKNNKPYTAPGTATGFALLRFDPGDVVSARPNLQVSAAQPADFFGAR